MSKLSVDERIHLERTWPFRSWVEGMLTEPSKGVKFAKEPLLTDEQKYFTEYLPHTEIVSDCEQPEPSFICPKCKCHSPAFAGGDSIVNVGGPIMTHYTFWKCLNPDCNHWWMLEDGEDE